MEIDMESEQNRAYLWNSNKEREMDILLASTRNQAAMTNSIHQWEISIEPDIREKSRK